MSKDKIDTTGFQVVSPLMWSAYAVAFMLVLMPVVDLVAALWPMYPGVIRWRYAATGLLSGNLMMPVTGLFVAVMTAAFMRHRLTLRVLSVLTGLASLMIFIASGMFILDTLQVRAEVVPQMLQAFTTSSAKALIHFIMAGIVAAFICFAGLRTARRMPKEVTIPERTADSSRLVMGSAAR